MQFMSQPRLLGHEGLLQGQIKVILKGHRSHCLWIGRIRRFCTPKFLFSSRGIPCGRKDENQRFQQWLTSYARLLPWDSPGGHRSPPKGRENHQEGHSAGFLHPETQMQDSGSQFDHLEDSLKPRSLGHSQNHWVTPRMWFRRSGVSPEQLHFYQVPKQRQCYWSKDLTLRTSDL